MALKHDTKTSDLGTNRTGFQSAPARAKEMLENTDAVPADPRARRGSRPRAPSSRRTRPPSAPCPSQAA